MRVVWPSTEISATGHRARSIVDNGASARICVDHELLNENVLYRFSCQNRCFFTRQNSIIIRSVNYGTTLTRNRFYKKNRKCKTSCFNRFPSVTLFARKTNSKWTVYPFDYIHHYTYENYFYETELFSRISYKRFLSQQKFDLSKIYEDVKKVDSWKNCDERMSFHQTSLWKNPLRFRQNENAGKRDNSEIR